MDDTTLQQDIETLGASPIVGSYAGSTVLVTGATGLIGSLAVRAALSWNRGHEEKIRVVALARSAEKARFLFPDDCDGNLRVIIGDIAETIEVDEPIDWISHGASITSSAAFASHPVEVATTELLGTKNVLEIAREKEVDGLVYLSSLEVYGDVPEGHGDVFEEDGVRLDWLRPRNSYPTAKQMCECLCAAYASEYSVPVKIARLAQIFGAGVSPDDQRVFAQFARAAITGEPITLHTPGEGRRCYCYTTDAVEGLLTVLKSGEPGQAYNIANPATYCSVREMAEMVVDRYRESGTELLFDCPEDLASFGFAAPSHVKLSSAKLTALGWEPHVQLPEMYDRLISSMKIAWGNHVDESRS